MTKANFLVSAKVLSFCLFAFGFQSSYASDFGCQPSDYVEVAGDAVIQTQGSSYVPRCLRVKAGAKVTVAASNHHPLQGVESSVGVNPMFDELGGAVQPTSYLFSEAGTFGYFCVAHGDSSGFGMAGAIQVVP